MGSSRFQCEKPGLETGKPSEIPAGASLGDGRGLYVKHTHLGCSASMFLAWFRVYLSQEPPDAAEQTKDMDLQSARPPWDSTGIA